MRTVSQIIFAAENSPRKEGRFSQSLGKNVSRIKLHS